MNGSRSPRGKRGFTLIELMVAVAIIGLLGSIAVPSYQRFVYRAKAAERRAIMLSIERGIEEIAQNQQHLPNWDPANPLAPTIFFGAPNPPILPGTTRSPINWGMVGWNQLPILVEGGTYYQYWFLATDIPALRQTNMTVFGQGDIDGDGVISWKQLDYIAIGYSFQLQAEAPLPGVNEDVF
jgi:prepilin-type N-terminal cleavage/methylation domain-containing protein